jgi:phosphatidylethanolamine N-methyltransferase
MVRRYERPAGLIITAYVYIVYVIALKYEGCVHSYMYPYDLLLTPLVDSPFTDMIYSTRATRTADHKKEL